MDKINDKYNIKLSGLCCRCKKKNCTPPHSCKAYPERDGIPPKVWRGDIKECEYFDEEEKI